MNSKAPQQHGQPKADDGWLTPTKRAKTTPARHANRMRTPTSSKSVATPNSYGLLRSPDSSDDEKCSSRRDLGKTRRSLFGAVNAEADVAEDEGRDQSNIRCRGRVFTFEGVTPHPAAGDEKVSEMKCDVGGGISQQTQPRAKTAVEKHNERVDLIRSEEFTTVDPRKSTFPFQGNRKTYQKTTI